MAANDRRHGPYGVQWSLMVARRSPLGLPRNQKHWAHVSAAKQTSMLGLCDARVPDHFRASHLVRAA